MVYGFRKAAEERGRRAFERRFERAIFLNMVWDGDILEVTDGKGHYIKMKFGQASLNVRGIVLACGVNK